MLFTICSKLPVHLPVLVGWSVGDAKTIVRVGGGKALTLPNLTGAVGGGGAYTVKIEKRGEKLTGLDKSVYVSRRGKWGSRGDTKASVCW